MDWLIGNCSAVVNDADQNIHTKIHIIVSNHLHPDYISEPNNSQLK